MQKLLLNDHIAKLRSNEKATREAQELELTEPVHQPVVKLFCPWGSATWLLSELDEHNVAYGLCDLGFGTPELGYVSVDEIRGLTHSSGLKIERDIHFEPEMTITEYAKQAREVGHIAA